MTKAKISELKDHLSRYLDRVRAGETVLVFDRNVPIAEIIPFQFKRETPRNEDEAFLLDLERRGIARVGKGKLPKDFFKPLRGKSSGVLEALLKERREGR